MPPPNRRATTHVVKTPHFVDTISTQRYDWVSRKRLDSERSPGGLGTKLPRASDEIHFGSQNTHLAHANASCILFSRPESLCGFVHLNALENTLLGPGENSSTIGSQLSGVAAVQ
jgi:hypothetical protein